MLLVLIVAAWRMPWWRWSAGEVIVSGNHLLPTARIVALLGLPKNPLPLYRIDPASLSARLAQVPEIESATVERWLFPSRLLVKVQERRPAARIVGPGSGVSPASQTRYLDASGVAFTLGASRSVPLLVQLPAGGLAACDRSAFRELVANWPPDATGSLDLRDDAAWQATIGSFVVHLGLPRDLAWKLRLFKALRPLAQSRSAGLEYIDLRYPRAPALRMLGGSLPSSLPSSATRSSSPG